jgi:hypothetical protein
MAMAWIDDEIWREAAGDTGLHAGRMLYWLATIIAACIVIFRARRLLHQLGAKRANRPGLCLHRGGGRVADRMHLPRRAALAIARSGF